MGMGPALGRDGSEGQECFPGSLSQERTKHLAAGSLGRGGGHTDLAGDTATCSGGGSRTGQKTGEEALSRGPNPQEHPTGR